MKCYTCSNAMVRDEIHSPLIQAHTGKHRYCLVLFSEIFGEIKECSKYIEEKKCL